MKYQMKFLTEQKTLRLLGLLAPALFVLSMSWGYLAYSWQAGREDKDSFAVDESFTGMGGIYLQEGSLGELPARDLPVKEGNVEGKQDEQQVEGMVTAETAADKSDLEVKDKRTEPAFALGQGLNETGKDAVENEAALVGNESLVRDKETEETSWISGNFMLPVAGQEKREILRNYGLSYSATYEDYRFHEGLDLAASLNEEAVAAAPGRVKEVFFSQVKKYTVVLEHSGGWESRYSHLERVSVEADQYVEQGEAIGVIAEPGLEEIKEGPHVHWELWLQGERQNPSKYIAIEN